jgi:predicted HicB family RNase H-like nuclease
VIATLERPTTGANVPKQGEPQNEDPQAEERVNFSARVRVSVRRRAKLYAAGHDINLQDLVDQALDDYLRRHGA